MNADATKNPPPRWTLARVRDMHSQLEGRCQAEDCGWFGVFDLDRLIDQLGPDWELPENVPGMVCGVCGASPVKFQLASLHRDEDGASP
ncbi:MAG: hypothetical protein WD039_09075 [Xanthobacteraceae bacterium]